MITLFHLLQLTIVAACGGVGFALGRDKYGIAGALACGLVGLVLGVPLGRVPTLVAWYFTRPERQSTEQLRLLVHGPAWPYVQLALAELVRRGENVEQELDVVREMLLSDDPWKREHGYASLRVAAPALAEQLGAYDPRGNAPDMVAKIIALSWPSMTMTTRAHPTRAERRFRSYLVEHGLHPEQLTARSGVDAMLGFFREVAFSPQADGDPDMLLFQWGTYDLGQGAMFEVDITRQLIWPSEDEENEEELWQLSLTFRFESNEKLRALGKESRWCESQSELAELRKYMDGSEAFLAIAERSDAQVELRFSSAE